jgi:UDP-N-acetylglucosamine--N-acetylmuramyl-(pentapeptide) pyrophosphoryl-undecaprenol N-acetylglucosamine transferase
MSYKILLTGGGTGGHVYPLVAVAEELKAQASQKGIDLELMFLGEGELLKNLAGELGIKFRSVLSPKWRRYASIENLIDIFKAPIGFLQSLFYVWKFMPDVIFSKGGFASFLPSFTGKLLFIPLVIHESDAIPGKANSWLGKMADQVFVAMDGAQKYFKEGKTIWVGNPIRRGILSVVDKTAALAAFGLDSSRPVVLITGASNGAKVINDILLSTLVELTKNYQIIHQCGDKNYDEVNKQILSIVKEGEASYGQTITKDYRLYPLLDIQQMAWAYSAADVVVSRSGGTVFEIAALGKPAILIPWKDSASNHQLANARDLAKFGAIVIEEDNLTPHIFLREINEAYTNREALSVKIKEFAKPDAGAIIAVSLLAMLK